MTPSAGAGAVPEPALRNRMEPLVVQMLEEALADRPAACRCLQCRRDVVSLALSLLPARYAGSQTGAVVIDVELQRPAARVDVLQALWKAIDTVDRRPHHGRPS